MVFSVVDLLVPTLKIVEALTTSAKQSYSDKRSYEQKLEQAQGSDIYKYVLLINVSALEGYVLQARLQAQQSFNLSRVVAIAGFLIVAIAIGLSVYLTIGGSNNLDAAYLAGVAGVLTEFIAGVFFYLYSKTLNQINLFHDKLVDMQKSALQYIAATEAESRKPTPEKKEPVKQLVEAGDKPKALESGGGT